MAANPKEPNLITPPKLIPTFLNGFDMVANHIGLILMPILLDLLLWFGPHLRVKDLLQPFIQQLSTFPGFDTPDMIQIAQANQKVWQVFANDFNMVSFLRTYPIGVPSLISGEFAYKTPLGTAPVIDINSLLVALACWVGLIVVGTMAGSLYMNWISFAVFKDSKSVELVPVLRAIFQVFILTLVCFFALFLLSIPIMFFIALMYFINPGVAQFAVFLILIVLAWLLFPFLFSSHGIFAFRQNAFISIITSARLVRFSLPGTGLFVLLALLLNQGMNLLWQFPAEDSWMTLVGIAGHSFVTTAIITASFIYYRDGIRWAQEIMQRNLAAQKTSRA